MKTLLILLALTLPIQSFAHEVKPAPREESCDAAKWLGSILMAMPLTDPEYNRLDALASRAFDECEECQAKNIDAFSHPRAAGSLSCTDWLSVERAADEVIRGIK